MAPRDRAGSLEVVLGERGHLEAIAEFIRTVWNPDATAASVGEAWDGAAAGNPVDPGAAPPTWIAVKSGKVIGYLTTLPARWWDGARDWPGYWLKGLMVLPEFRNGPVGYSLLKAASGCLPRSGGLAVATPARRLFAALGYVDRGAIPNWLRPLRGGRILANLNPGTAGMPTGPRWALGMVRVAQRSGLARSTGALAGIALRAMAWVNRIPGNGFIAVELAAVPEAAALDGLWADARRGIRCGVVRDHQYLADRYPANPAGPYRWLAVTEGERLSGVAIVRIPGEGASERLAGLRVATLADIVFHPGQRSVGMALLGGVERLAHRLRADAVLASASAAPLAQLLRRQCYLRLPGTVHLLFRDTTQPAPAWPDRPEDWWLTRGDGFADEAL